MANVNFSEKEYRSVADAAMSAFRKGDRATATTLNELASKMNKGLTVAAHTGMSNMGHARAKWRAAGPLDKELGIGVNV